MATRLISADKLRWLFAETLVIVLGVLIALGLNDAWSARQDRLLAIDYIYRFQGSVNADLAYIRDWWKPRLSMKREALEEALPVVRGQAPVPEDVRVFFRNISRGGMMSGSVQSWIADTVFQDIRATGNMRLISDPDVRAEISRYYGVTGAWFERLRGRHTGYVSYVHTAIPAELRDDMSIEALNDFGVDYALNRFLSDEFRNLANEEYNVVLFMQTLEFERYAETLLSELDDYLSELDGS